MLKNIQLYTFLVLVVAMSMLSTQFQPALAQPSARIDPAALNAPSAGPSFIQQMPGSAVSRIVEGGGWIYWSDYLPPPPPGLATQEPQAVTSIGIWRRGVYGRLYSTPGPVPLVMS